MFFGKAVNVARYDKQKYPVFEKLIEKQLSFFWRPEEVSLMQDYKDFVELTDAEKHIFTANLKYQILLDSVQGRSPNVALLPVVSLPELETWIETWAFYETIHSRSYTHIIRNIYPDPSVVFDSIVDNEKIVARAESVTKYYDDFIDMANRYNLGMNVDLYELKKSLYLLIASINILEGVRFYVSFACSFSFAERTKMEGNAKIIKMIARDEALHLTGTQHILQIMRRGVDDPDFATIAKDCEAEVLQMFKDAAAQEKDWADYLFKDGSMLGMNKEIITQYVEYITDQRMEAINLPPLFGRKQNPIPWMSSWLSSDNVQVAPQETEISSYLVGAIDSTIEASDLEGFEL